jgi:hypothetical protein
MRAGSLSDTGCVQDCKPSSCTPMWRQPLGGTRRDIARNSVRSDWRTTDRAPPFRNAGPHRIRKAQLPEKRSFFALPPPLHRDIVAARKSESPAFPARRSTLCRPRSRPSAPPGASGAKTSSFPDRRVTAAGPPARPMRPPPARPPRARALSQRHSDRRDSSSLRAVSPPSPSIAEVFGNDRSPRESPRR